MSLFLGQHLKVFCSVIRRYLSAMEHLVGTGFLITYGKHIITFRMCNRRFRNCSTCCSSEVWRGLFKNDGFQSSLFKALINSL